MHPEETMRVLILSAFLALPLGAQDDCCTCAAGNILREWRGTSTAHPGEGFHVVRDAGAWAKVWAAHGGKELPLVDFQHEMVIAAFPAGNHEIGWTRITHLERPGLSKFWIGLCPSPAKSAFHIAVVGRSDLDVEFWIKDPGLNTEIGKEAERGGTAVGEKLVHGTSAPDARRVAPLTPEGLKIAKVWVEQLASGDMAERDQAMRGIERIGAPVRPVLRSSLEGADVETATRLRGLLERIPTFDEKAVAVTREQAIFAARSHCSVAHPDKFTNDPHMRWEDDCVRYTVGPHWEVRLRYL